MNKNEFKGINYCFSNNYHTKIEIDGFTFNNATAAYLSFKDQERQSEFQTLLPSQAEELASKIETNEDWEERRLHYLYRVLVEKFSQNKMLMERILEFDITELKEGDMKTVLRLVKQYIRSSVRIANLMKEQTSFNYKISE